MRLVLASTSRYRRGLLERLRLPFDVARPEADETPLPGEAPVALAGRLAEAKAAAVARLDPDAWVIGSDQVAELDGHPLGKPGGREAAIAQLAAMSGRTVAFHTGVCLLRGAGTEHLGPLAASDTTRVRFRRLDRHGLAPHRRDVHGSRRGGRQARAHHRHVHLPRRPIPRAARSRLRRAAMVLARHPDCPLEPFRPAGHPAEIRRLGLSLRLVVG